MPTTIYALCEPDLRVPVIRYVGKTVNLPIRFKSHLSQTVKESTRVGNWLKSLVHRGEKPVLMTLDEVADDLGAAAEMLYIRLAREGGMDLCNLTDGGDGITPTPEIKSKLSAAKRGSLNPNFGKSFGRGGGKNPFSGKKHSRETKERQSKAQKGVSWRRPFSLHKLPKFSDGGGI